MSIKSYSIVELERRSSAQLAAMAEIWRQACGPDLAVPSSFVAHNLQPYAHVEQTGWLAVEDRQPVGFVLASVIHGRPAVAAPGTGWLDVLAVLPAFQQRGLGNALLERSESWLIAQGCTHVHLGGSPRLFVPGLPAELETDDFFCRHGFRTCADSNGIWDVAINLAGYGSKASEVNGAVRPALPGQVGEILAFLAREFPGRWHYEAEAFLENGGRPSDFMILWTAAGIDGFCQLTFEDSARPIERYRPYRLPRPWGQLGPIGVSAGVRGQGFGGTLLDAGLRRLHNNGVNGCVIDWTEIPEFYAKYGFERFREYRQLVKAIM